MWFVFHRFGMFEELKRHTCDEKGHLSPHKRVLCGLGKISQYHYEFWWKLCRDLRGPVWP
jgi:hypothetical protein